MVLSAIRSRARQVSLRLRFSKNNTIGHDVMLSRDLVIAGGASIGDNSVIEQGVRLSKNVRVGAHVRLSRIEVGTNSFIELGVVCTGNGGGKIVIGKECYIGIRNVLDWSDDILIGDYVHIAGPCTGLWTHSSVRMCLDGIPLSMQGDKDHRPTAPITIASNVYIGGNCTIYPGVTIHHHAVVAPNSAVTEDVPPFTMVGGVPARRIKRIRR